MSLAYSVLKWLWKGSADLPASHPTISYWQQDPHDLANHQSTKDLSQEVQYDFCIIGSGLSGVSVALEIFRLDPSAKVIMLEARQACSGATGRNGGHLMPQNFHELFETAKVNGFESALAEFNFRRANAKVLRAYIAENKLEELVGFRDVPYHNSFFSDGLVDDWAGVLEAWRYAEERGVDLSDVELHEGAEADRVGRTTNAVGCISGRSAVFWPYKLVCHFLEICLANGMQLHCNTPVESMSINTSDPNHPVTTLETPRGQVRASKVVHATNAYVSHLLTELQSGLIPLLGQVTALKPEGKLADKALGSYGIATGISGLGIHEYMHQREEHGMAKEIIIGGEARQVSALRIGDSDDSSYDPKVFDKLRQVVPECFAGEWSGGKEAVASFSWSGAQAITWDRKPIVGSLAKPGHFVLCGYSGHGMVRCHLTAQYLVRTIFGEPTEEIVQRPDLIFTDPKSVSLVSNLYKLALGRY